MPSMQIEKDENGILHWTNRQEMHDWMNANVCVAVQIKHLPDNVVKYMADTERHPDFKTRNALLNEWANMGLYEGGIDWEAPEPPSGDAGLTVVEFKQESKP